MTRIHRFQLQLGTACDVAYFALLWSARPRVVVDGQPLGTFRWRRLGATLRRQPGGTIEVRLIGPGLGRQNVSTTLAKDFSEAQAFAAIYLPDARSTP